MLIWMTATASSGGWVLSEMESRRGHHSPVQQHDVEDGSENVELSESWLRWSGVTIPMDL